MSEKNFLFLLLILVFLGEKCHSTGETLQSSPKGYAGHSKCGTIPPVDCLIITKGGDQLFVELHVDDSDLLDLVDIETVNPNIILDIVYATTDNIMGQKLYGSSKCYLRRHVAMEIDEIQKELEAMGLGLKIFDAFRPVSVQRLGFEMYPEWFAMPNEERAKHPRGTAVDVTIVDKNGNDILMPTVVDDLTEKAERRCRDYSDGFVRVENREILEAIMAKHGFIGYAKEWWHFDHYTWKTCPVIYLEFDEIEEILHATD